MVSDNEKDIFNNELKIGDAVATQAKNYRGLVIGEIVSFTPQKVRVKYINNWNYTPGREEEYLTESEWIVKKPLTLSSNSDINIE